MNRKRIVAGNWKMNNTYDEGLKLVSEIVNMVADEVNSNTRVVICTPYIHLHSAKALIGKNPSIYLGAQNCAMQDQGAYTGEVSATMLASVGVQYVIIGHSERRSLFHETDNTIATKVDKVLMQKMTPIFCCGESLSDRESNGHFQIVKEQLESGLFHLSADAIQAIVIAYEPVWAIGTGLTATPQQAQEMHAFIRKTVADKYDQEIANSMSILYGGSCNANNAAVLFANADVDGGLIGGASLKSRDFTDIIKACKS